MKLHEFLAHLHKTKGVSTVMTQEYKDRKIVVLNYIGKKAPQTQYPIDVTDGLDIDITDKEIEIILRHYE